MSGRGVQTNLLKLMEETEVPLRSQTDLQSQLQAAMEFQRGAASQKGDDQHAHILFIVSGAFDNCRRSCKRRFSKSEIGFARRRAPERETEDSCRGHQTRDLIDYGMEPEFVGRLPVRVACSALQVDDLFAILKQSEGSLMRQYEEVFRAYGIRVMFTDDGMRAWPGWPRTNRRARAGCHRGRAGAAPFKFDLPGSGVRRFVVHEKLVLGPEAELRRVLTRRRITRSGWS